MERVIITKEFLIKSTVSSLYKFISTPSGLSQWFCDSAKELDDNRLLFMWSKSENEVKVLERIKNSSAKYEWDDGRWFELKILKEELTGTVSLIVQEQVDEDEVNDINVIWDHNIKRLKLNLGTSGR